MLHQPTTMPGDIRIGVFVPNGAQLLDTATVDVLGVMSREYLELAGELVPSHIYAIAPNVSIYYITTPSGGADVPLTAGAVIRATHDYTDKDVAPGRLDMVVVPGPEPSSEFEEGALDWLRRQSETPGVDILSVCTGLLLCGAAGVADGKRVSGPRGMQNVLHKRFPHMKLVGDKYRWVRDGNLWSSGMSPSYPPKRMVREEEGKLG